MSIFTMGNRFDAVRKKGMERKRVNLIGVQKPPLGIKVMFFHAVCCLSGIFDVPLSDLCAACCP